MKLYIGTLSSTWRDMYSIARAASLFFVATSLPVYSSAEEKGAVRRITLAENSLWRQLPWIWVIGGGIFILLLLVMLRTVKKHY